MSEVTAQGGPMMVNGKQFLPDTWADQVWWPGTKKTVVDVVSTKEEAAAETARVNKFKRANDIRSYPVAPNQTIHAGDVVDVVGGEVGKTWRAEANVERVVDGAPTPAIAVQRLSEQYSIIAWCNTTIGDSRVGVVRNSDGMVVGSSNTVFYSSKVSNLFLARLSDTKFVVVFRSGGGIRAAKVGTVSGSSIVFGADYTTNSFNSSELASAELSDHSYIEFYNQNGLKAKVFSVTDTVINTTGTTEALLPGNTSASYLSATRLPDLNGNKRVCVCFSDGSDGNKGKAVIATIKPDNTVEWGTVVTFSAETTYETACCLHDADVVVLYKGQKGGNIQLNAQVLSIFESTAVPNDFCEINRGAPSDIDIASVGEKLVCTANLSSSYGGPGAMVLSRAENVLTPNQRYQFNGVNNSVYANIEPLSEEKFMISYADAGNSNYGTATILEVQGDQIAGSFTDVSAECIALQDTTAGQPCEVIFDGVAELPGFLAGTEINSPGVYGYCPEDGRVWVRPEWDVKPVGDGAYLGDGVNKKITLSFNRPPKLVLISGDSGTACLMIFVGSMRYGVTVRGSGPAYLSYNEAEWSSEGKTLSFPGYSTVHNQAGIRYKYVWVE